MINGVNEQRLFSEEARRVHTHTCAPTRTHVHWKSYTQTRVCGGKVQRERQEDTHRHTSDS